MASVKITSWLGGINTRVNKFRIALSELVNASDSDLSGLEAKPQKGLDVQDTADGDYRFRGSWIVDSVAKKFTEAGDLIIKSYSDASAKFNRRYYNSSGDFQGLVGDKTLGAPGKPTAPTVSLTTSGTPGGSNAKALSSIFTQSFGTAQTDADSNTGLFTDPASNDNSGATIIRAYGDKLVLVNKSTGLIRRRDIVNGTLAPGGLSDITLTHRDEVFMHNEYVIGIKNASSADTPNYTHVSIVNATSGTSETVKTLPTQPQNWSSIEYNSSSHKSGYYNAGIRAFAGACSYSINEGNLFISKNYIANWRDIQNTGHISGSMSQAYNARRSATYSVDSGQGLLVISLSSTPWSGFNYYNSYITSSANWNTSVSTNLTYNSGFGWPMSNLIHQVAANSVSTSFTMKGHTYHAVLYTNLYVSSGSANSSNRNYWSAHTNTGLSRQGSATFQISPIDDDDCRAGFWTFGIGGFSSTVTSATVSHSSDTLTITVGSNSTTFDTGSDGLTVTNWPGVNKTITTRQMGNVPSPNGSGSNYVHTDFPSLYQKTLFNSITKIPLANPNSMSTEDANTNAKGIADQTNMGPWVWRQNWDSAMANILVNNTTEDDTIQPLRSNLVVVEEATTFTASTYGLFNSVTSFDQYTPNCNAYLIAESDLDLSDKASGGSISFSNQVFSDFIDKFMTYQAIGQSETSDRIFYGTRGGTSYTVYNNNRSSGSTQFGTSQGTVTLSNSGFDVEKMDTTSGNNHRLIFINSGGSGDTINVVNLATLAVTTGSATYGTPNGVKDFWVDSAGTKYVIKIDTNRLSVINPSSNNESSLYSLPFDRFTYSSGVNYYGVTTSSGAIDDLKKCYAFFMSEVEALTTGGLLNHDSSKNRNISTILKQNAENRYIHILFTDDNSFTYNNASFKLNLSGSRTPTITAENVASGTITGTSNSSGHLIVSGSLAYQTMVKDNLAVDGGNEVVSSKTGVLLTLGSPISASASYTAVRTRYVSKNRAWFSASEHGNLQTESSLVDSNFSTGAYGSSVYKNTQFYFSSETGKDFIPVSKSISSYASDPSGNNFFYADLDKNLIKSNSADIGVSSYTIGGVDIYNPDGANIPFQYKVSYLRDVKHPSESESVYIEGPSSDESSEITLSDPAHHTSISSITNIPNDVSKVRVYRVGGDYAYYYWLADLDVANQATTKYDDTVRTVGSVIITPPLDMGQIPSKLENIVQVNGIYIGNVEGRLYFSKYGTPHNWPEYGYQDIDGKVMNITEYAGEALVFTANSTYRVRGYNWDSMQIIKVPDRQGLPTGNYDSLTQYKGSVYFISNDGLCSYTNGSIQIISSSKLDSFPPIHTPRSAFKDEVLYIFNGNSGSSEPGVKLDTRSGQMSYGRITQKALSRAFYDQTADRLYLKGSGTNGSYATGSNLSMTLESGEINGGDAENQKMFFRYKILYTAASNSTIKFYQDGAVSEFQSDTLSSSSSETCYYGEFTNYRIAKSVRYKIEGDINVYGMEIYFEPMNTYFKRTRFNHIDVQYEGSSLNIQLYMDNNTITSTPDYTSTDLPAATGVKTARLYYPESTLGYVPHYVATGTGNVIAVDYSVSDI